MLLFYLLMNFFLLQPKSSYNLKLLLFNIYLLSFCLNICEFNTKVKFSGAEYFALSMAIKNVYYHPCVHVSTLFNSLHMIILGDIPLVSENKMYFLLIA